jgi:exosortase K
MAIEEFPGSRVVKTKMVWFALILLAVWTMKRYYSAVGPNDLWWILGPTAHLAGGTTNSFAAEPGAGYLSRERLFLIEKSCAGLNFMIAAFAMLTFTLRRRVTSFCSGAMVLAGSLAAAYAATIAVNAVRIAIAMRLASHQLAVAHLTPAQCHRLEGIVVYFAGLALLHEIALHAQRRAAFLRSNL